MLLLEFRDVKLLFPLFDISVSSPVRIKHTALNYLYC